MENITEKELQEELERRLSVKKQTKNKIRFSNLVVAAIVILNSLFTIAVLYLFKQTGNEPTILIGAWFGFTTVELFSLAKIKREKIKKECEECE